MDMESEDPPSVAAEPCVASPIIRHSTRLKPWYIYPLNESGVFDICGNGPKILCGYLFNAEAERLASGQTVGEECCINLEPIADACLSFAPDLRVQQLYPEYTGVELLCGHRFSASCLLWYWCLNAMICPVCRAKYALGSEPVHASPGNFPLHACNKLTHRIEGIKKAEDNEQQQADREFIMENLMQDAMQNIVHQTIQSVLGDPKSFYVILSLQNEVSTDVARCMQLYRNPDDSPIGIMGRMKFNVQYSQLRRFNSVTATDPTPNLDSTSYHLAASLVMTDPTNADRMVEISRLALVDIERGVATPNVTLRCTGITGHMDIEFCQHDPTVNPPRILSLQFNVDTTSLLDAVARLFTYEVSLPGASDDTTTIVSISPPADI